MMQKTKITRYRLTAFLLAAAVLLIGGVPGMLAQESRDEKPIAGKRTKETGRDPFRKYEAPRVVVKKKDEIVPPSIQARIEQYKAQKLAAMNARMPAPKPTTALLLREVQVVGISRTPRGYAAIVEAIPIKLSYVIYPGERFYDGHLVAIEDSRLVFRHETVFSDGRRERSVEIKPLRQASDADAMTAAKAVPANGAAGDSEKKSNETPATKP
jgi:hypothetical protein